MVFILLAIHWLVPMYVMHVAQGWYGKQGADYHLEIGSWRFSPVTGLMVLENLIFNHGNEFSQFGHAEVNISMLALFQKTLEIESLNLTDGKLNVVQSEKSFNVLGIQVDRGKRTQSKDQDVQQEKGLSYKIGKIHIENQTIEYKNNNDIFQININNLNMLSESSHDQLNIEGMATLTSLEIPSPAISITSPVQFVLSGMLESPFSHPIFRGSAKIKSFNIVTPWLPTTGFDLLSIDDMFLSTNEQSFGDVEFNNFHINENLLSLQEYLINDIKFVGNTVTTGLHKWRGLNSQLDINADNQVQQLKISKSHSAKETSDVSVVSDNKKEGVTWRIEGINQYPEDESRVLITASHLQPMLEIPIVLKNVNINNLNMEGDLIHFHAEASTDEYSKFIADGNVSPDFNDGHLNVDITQFDLVSLNGFVNQIIGYHVEKGQLNLSSNIKMKSGRLSGSTDLYIRNNNMVPSDEEIMDRISQKISMPIESALSLIKDDENNIKLNFPVEGYIHSPDFGMNDLALKLSKTAIQSATLHYIQLALFPYGIALDIAGYLGDQIFTIKLMPMVIESDKLNEEQRAYSEKIAEMMLEKTVLQLHLCPLADGVLAKREGWQKQVKQHANIIKRHIVAQDNQLSSRVLICQPRVGDKTQVLMGF